MSDKSKSERNEYLGGSEFFEENNEQSSDFSLDERPRGILTQADREYLCGLKEYAHAQTISNRKQDIRERVRNGLKDFGLLWLFLDPVEREKIFDELGKEHTDICIQSMISFAYLGLNKDRPRMETLIEHGVVRGENVDEDGRWEGDATDADVSINIEYGHNVDELYEQLQEGNTDQLTTSEIGALVQAGKLEAEDLEKVEDSSSTVPKLSHANVTGENPSSEDEE